MSAGDPVIPLRFVWSHRFHRRPVISRGNHIYRLSVHWLWFFLGVVKVPDSVTLEKHDHAYEGKSLPRGSGCPACELYHKYEGDPGG